jgi:protoheme IX farnesyltransferase
VKDARAETAAVPAEPLSPLGSTRRLTAVLSDYVALTKPRLNVLVVATSAAGYYLGAATPPAPWSMAVAVCGTALVAAGSAVLNQVYERDTDALMRRTRLRPLPDGRVTADEAAILGVGLAALGILLLVVRTNELASLLALATLILYVVIYTPLKRRSEMATLVGAIPGALPPLIGWAAAHGSLSIGGWVLFAIVFLWQIPHFMAISWLYREDYSKAGFPMLPVIDPGGRSAGRQALIYAWALLPVTLLPTAVGLSGRIYFWIALILGSGIVWLSWRFALDRSDRIARALFLGSIVYLPLIWVAMILNH